MSTSNFDAIVQRYEEVLLRLAESIHVKKLSKEEYLQTLLDVLVIRHTIQVSINRKAHITSEILGRINAADKNLRELAKYINLDEELTELKTILHGANDHWWEIFESSKPSPLWDRFDALCSFLSLIFLGISAGLAVDIFTRILSGGPDIQGTYFIIVQSFFALIAGGTLTQPGQEILERTFKSLRGLKRYWHELSFILAVILCIFLISYRNSLPNLAIKYNQRGYQEYITKKYVSAEENFNRALRIDPDYAEANFNLAQLHEDLQDERAKTGYQLAVKGGFYKAYHRLGRIYILQGSKDKDNYSKAIALLTEGLSKVEKEAPNDKETQYYLRTYIGWARLGQKRYSDAKPRLKEAINIKDSLVAPEPDLPKALPHCLLAQVLEEQNPSGNRQEVQKNWSECAAIAQQRISDEDAWLGIARKRSNLDREDVNKENLNPANNQPINQPNNQP